MLQKAEPDFSRQVVIQALPTDNIPPARTRVIGVEMNSTAGVALDDADVVVSVGMGIGGPENLPVVREFAAVLDAPVVGTRRVVDAGWLPRQVQIGLTGRSIAPRLYVALGISGKFNHMVGVQRADLILAVNANPEADIFKQADYGIVGDWAEVVPALTLALKQARQPV
jgi:electron transfer flavoprotein alpha subunit